MKNLERPFDLIYRTLPDLPERLVEIGIERAMRMHICKFNDYVPIIRKWVETEMAVATKAAKAGAQTKQTTPGTPDPLMEKVRRIAAEEQAGLPAHIARHRAAYARFRCERERGLLSGDIGYDLAATRWEGNN